MVPLWFGIQTESPPISKRGLPPMNLVRMITIITMAIIGLSSCRFGSNNAAGRSPAIIEPKCSSRSSSDCASNSNCQLNDSICSGTYNFCSGFSSENVCPSGSCFWSSTDKSCGMLRSTATTTSTCSGYTQSTCSTVSGCSWNGISCVDSTTSLSCSNFSSEPTCPTTSCTWTGSVCTSCSTFTTQAACSVVQGCAWSGTTCALSTTTTPTPSNGTYCAPISTNILCAAAPGCFWDGSGCKLLGSGRAPQPSKCSPFDTETICKAGVGCQWLSSRCLRPSVGVGTPFTAGDGLSSEGTSINQLSNCSFSAILQSDGNFVINRGNGSTIWTSNSAGKGGNKLIFQTDGNFVLYNSANTAVWKTSTANQGGQGLVLTTNGNLLVVSSTNAVLWQSNSAVAGCN